MKNRIMIAVVVIIGIITSPQAFAQDDQNVVIKNGSTLTVYTLTTYGGGSTEITTNTYTGADVSTLKSLGIPQDAWQLFANNTNLLFSTQAFVLAQQKKEVDETLEVTTEDRDWNANQFGGYRNAFWILLIFSVVAIVILSIKLHNANKRR